MSENPEHDPQEFVLSGDDEASLLDAVAPLGVVCHEVVAHEPHVLILATLADCSPDPQQALSDVRAHLKGVGTAQEPMHDQFGAALLPTGTIQVRFFEAPTDEDLIDFSKQAGLRVLKRNEFQPAQASFELVNADTTDLMEEIDKLAKRPDVRRVWPEVLSRYRR